MSDYAAILLIVATMADIASTEYAMRRGLSERNPVARKLMEVLGRFWGAPKLLAAGIVWVYSDGVSVWVIGGLALVMFAVAANNMRLARR